MLALWGRRGPHTSCGAISAAQIWSRKQVVKHTTLLNHACFNWILWTGPQMVASVIRQCSISILLMLRCIYWVAHQCRSALTNLFCIQFRGELCGCHADNFLNISIYLLLSWQTRFIYLFLINENNWRWQDSSQWPCCDKFKPFIAAL